ncbi:MAG: class I SAM-dependent methyltransferase [Nitrosomonadales bacterium]|nr:class I SAM-dependent methyltransferase [Nitrosomonadales bacterium]
MTGKSHWEHVYQTRPTTQVSWFQEHAERSLQFIHNTAVAKDGCIMDVGGGASTLVDDLLREGYSNLSVLDISAAALQVAQQRLGADASRVRWIEADITQIEFPQASVDVWHDRAVFHFLTDPQDRQRYVQAVLHAVKPGGHVIVATFAEDGPLRCSGLDIVRYRPDTLHDEFGDEFKLVDSMNEMHHTPSGADQKFVYCYCRR